MSNREILIEDLTDEFYESGTHQVKHWLISNLDHSNERQTELPLKHRSLRCFILFYSVKYQPSQTL